GASARRAPSGMTPSVLLLALDVRLADDAGVGVGLAAHVGAELAPAGADREQPLLGELRRHVGSHEGGAEPVGELIQRVARRLRRRYVAVKNVGLVGAEPG